MMFLNTFYTSFHEIYVHNKLNAMYDQRTNKKFGFGTAINNELANERVIDLIEIPVCYFFVFLKNSTTLLISL